MTGARATRVRGGGSLGNLRNVVPGCLAALTLTLGCGAETVPAALGLPASPPSHSAHREGCPEAHLLRWHPLETALDGSVSLGPALRMGGHVLEIAVDPIDHAVVGRLDVKGARELEDRTRELARGTYAHQVHDAGVDDHRLAIVLDHVVVASEVIVTTLRGTRFRLHYDPDALHAAELDARLQHALATDRICFNGP